MNYHIKNSGNFIVSAALIVSDGAEVSRRYIYKNPLRFAQDVKELKELNTDKEIEEWTIKQGAKVISSLGAEVDRLEVVIKSSRPEVKHIDLEIL